MPIGSCFSGPPSTELCDGSWYHPSPEFVRSLYPEFMHTEDEDDEEDPEEDLADYPADEGDDAEAASTSHSLPLPPPIILSHTRPDAPSTSSPPLHLLSTDRRADRPEVTLPPWKKLGIALGLRYEVGESSSAAARSTGGLRVDYGFVATMNREIMRDLERHVGYGITDTWDEILVDMPGAPATDDTELGRRMTEFTTRVRQDTDEIYMRLDDEQSEQQLMAGRLNMLYRDRRAHARTARLIEAEARMSQED
ncbi:hypothetical protein Tco_0451119 [Tanacetum coccineum]